MELTVERNRGPIGNGRGYLVNLVVLLLVCTLLGGNLLALGMSLPPVLENAGRTYGASTYGGLLLPFFPDGSTSCSLHAPSTVDEGVPFNVTLTFGSGSRPHTLQYIVLSSDIDELRYKLWDSWTPGGSWIGWTRVPGLEGGANWTVEALSGHENGPSTKLSTSASVNVIRGGISFLLPLTDKDLSTSGTIRFKEVRREDHGRYHPNYTLHERSGRSITLASEDLSYAPTGPWNEFDLECKVHHEPSIPHSRLVKYQKGFLVGTGWDLTHDPEKATISFETVLDHKDSLYEIAITASLQKTSSNVTLMAGTYYHATYTIPSTLTENSWYPLPEMMLLSEGKVFPLAPTPQRSVWKGVMFAPDGYGEDGRTEIAVGPGPGWKGGPDLLNLNVLLSDDPSPDITMKPDPFSMDGWNGKGPLKVSFRGEWELVNWRLFRERPQVQVNGSDLEPVTVTDGYEYSILLDLTSNGTVDERMLVIGARTFFQPAETVLLFLKLKGPLLPLWFMVLFVTIVVSCSVLIGRGLRPLIGGGLRQTEGKVVSLLRDRDNDLIATSRTYVGALFFSLSVVILFNIMEQPTPVPDILSDRVPIWIRMVILAHASVWEEVITRVLMIGAPLALWAVLNRDGGKAVRALLGGHGSVSVPAAVLILVSAGLFGLAHIGWGVWKIVPTFVMGLLFGYLYVKVGLHASIALHFLFDYSSFLAELVDGQQGPFIWSFLLIASLFGGGVMLADLLTGVVSWFGTMLPASKRLHLRHWNLFLVAHGATAALFGAFIMLNTELWVVGAIMLSVPVIDGVAFLLDRHMGGPLPKMLVYASSLATLPGAPLGLAWAIGPDR